VSFLISNLGLIFTNRSWSRIIVRSSLADPGLWAVTFGALAFLALVVYCPPLARLFRFSPLGAVDVAICFAAGAIGITWFEVAKLIGRGITPSAPISSAMSRGPTPS
jgi:hypothetical protein